MMLSVKLIFNFQQVHNALDLPWIIHTILSYVYF